MPNAYLKDLADKGQHGSMAELEKKWKEAGDIANKQAAKNPDIVNSYAYITSIFQNLIGVKPSKASVMAAVMLEAQTAYIRSLARQKKYGTLSQLKKKWEQAKGIANAGAIRSYPYLVAVFQNLIGIRKTAPKKK